MRKNYKWYLLIMFILSITAFSGSGPEKQFPEFSWTEPERAIQFCPAYPDLVNVKNPDGTAISFYLKGDEVLHWQVTQDGYTLLQNDEGYYCFATRDANGNLIPSDVVATNNKLKSKVSFPKNLVFSKSQISKALQARNELFYPQGTVKTKSSKNKGFTTGVRKVLVLLIDFKDRPFVHSQQEYDDMMNQDGYNGTGSFKDYYKAVSYNQLTCETTVKGPYHADGKLAKYGSNINGNKYVNAKLLVQEAVDAAELDGVNFADYDNDKDGNVDAVIVVHSGNDEAQGAGSNALWSHQSALRYNGMQRTYDGVTIDVYNIDPGVTGATGDAMATIGVFCHEFGHALGLPDTYDIDYSGALSPARWDVMDNGSYNNGSQTPAYHNPWARTKLGWQVPVAISDPATGLTLADCSDNKDLFRINTQTTGEYYILENRQQTGFNEYVYGHGLLIWHIDSAYISTAGNGVNTDPNHQGVGVVRADDVAANSAANPFPGTAGITSFTDETSPSMKSIDGRRVYKPITNIQENLGSISFDFVQGLPAIDAGVIAVINPVSGISSSANMDVTIKIKNFGSSAVSNFQVSYALDAGIPVTETFTNSIEPGTEAEFTFATQVVISEGEHNIEASTAATGDLITDNDKAVKTLTFFSSVFSFPFSEDFEGTFPPTSWKILNPDVPLGTWVQKNVTGINGTSTNTAFIDYWNYNGTRDNLLTPPINLADASAPTLSFNYAYHKTNPDGLAIEVSTDFGETYTTIWEKSGEDLATVPSINAYNDFTPTAGDQWKTVSLGLNQYIGKKIIISFTGISANGDNIYIDDVKIDVPTCNAPSSATNFSVTNLTKNSATVNWERGDGIGVIVLQRTGQNVDGVPQNGTIYSNGDMIGGSKVIYIGDATTRNLTELAPAIGYNFAIYEISNTNCYSTSSLTGNFTTLGLASVSTVTVRDLQATSATIIGNVTSIGEAPVTERGICYSTSSYALGVDYDHIVCQSGIGAFEASITDFNSATPYYAVAYAKNMYGVAYGNVITFYTSGGCDYLNYLPTNVQKGTDTYTDLGTDGIEISVENTDNANSTPIDIGFPFEFNCLTFDKFILNTNGFIKLGTVEPSIANLFQASNKYGVDEGFFSVDYRDQYLISPFQYDLIGTPTASYKVFTSGVAPNRVTTIQFKDLQDNVATGAPVQYNSIEFQIKLYETTNVIEFIYGTFTTSVNGAQYKYAQVGIKGGGYAKENQVNVSKSSAYEWASASVGNYGNTGTFSCKNSVLPASGTFYRFNPSGNFSEDASVADIYALTNLPADAGMPQTVFADIKNNGLNEMTNITVNLEVTGNNSYTATPIVISNLPSGSTERVTFPAFVTSSVGTNTVNVFINAGDMNASNDSKSVTQTVSTNTYSYTVGNGFVTSYNTQGVASVKYHVSGTRIIKTVNAYCGSTSAPGKSTKAYVFDSAGNVIGESDATTIVSGWNVFTITTPPTVPSSDFYVGIDATPYTSYFLASVQPINAINTGVNVVIPVGGGTPVDFANPYRFMITAEIDLPAITDKPEVVTDNEVTHPADADAIVSGSIVDDKGAAITERGFYWSAVSPVSTSSNKITSATNALGAMSETITGLTPGNTYYFAGFATNSEGTTLGEEKSFVKKYAQTISFGSLADIYYEDTDLELTATASSSLPVNYTSSNPNIVAIVESGGKYYIHIVTTGVCTITASQNGDGSYASATDVKQSLTVKKKVVAVTIPDLSRTFNYASQAVVPTPVNYNYKITYNGNKYAPVDVASYTVVATIDDANYEGTTIETMVINKANSVITFNPISGKNPDNEDFFPDVMASSGLDISLVSENLSVATIVNGKIHIVGTGTSKITASSTGNVNFNAPADQDQVLTVKSSQIITFNTISKQYGDIDFAPGSVNSGLELAYQSSKTDIASIVDGKVHIMGIGSTTITATQAGNATWAPTEKSYILTVGKGEQAITMDNISKAYGDADFKPAIINSGLTIAYSSDNSSVATVVDGSIHIVGTGTTNIKAEQPGNAYYNAASPVIKVLTVTDQTKPLITLLGDATVEITKGSAYTDAGATASDNLDGDITDQIIVDQSALDVNTAGEYIITYNVSDVAGNAADQVTRTVKVTSPTGFNETVQGNIKIYPNPSNGMFKIELPAKLVPYAKITVRDINGKNIQTIKQCQLLNNVNIENEARGIYFMTISTSENEQTFRLIVE